MKYLKFLTLLLTLTLFSSANEGIKNPFL